MWTCQVSQKHVWSATWQVSNEKYEILHYGLGAVFLSAPETCQVIVVRIISETWQVAFVPRPAIPDLGEDPHL